MSRQLYRVAWYNAAGRRVRSSPVHTSLHLAKAARDAAAAKSRARVIVETRLDAGEWETYD